MRDTIHKNNIESKPEDFFRTNSSGISFYDKLIEKPIYYEKYKGIKYSIINITPREFIEQVCQFLTPHEVDKQIELISKDQNTKDLFNYYNQHKNIVGVFNLPILDYSGTYGEFNSDGRHRMYLAGTLFGWDTEFPTMMVTAAPEVQSEGFKATQTWLDEDEKKTYLSASDVEELAKKEYQADRYFKKTNKIKFDNNRYFILPDGTILYSTYDHSDIDFWLAELSKQGYKIEGVPEFNSDSDDVDDFASMDHKYEYYPIQYWDAIRVGSMNYDGFEDDDVDAVHIQLPSSCHISPTQLSVLKTYLEQYLDQAWDYDIYIGVFGEKNNVGDRPLSEKEFKGYTHDINIDYLIKQVIGNINYYINNKTFKEDLEEAVHYGDLGKSRNDNRSSFQGGDRHTSGFGSGTYFLSKDIEGNEPTYTSRPKHEIDISKYNLFKPKDYKQAKDLHDTLRDICNYDLGGPHYRVNLDNPNITDNNIEISVYDKDEDDYILKPFNKEIYGFTQRLRKVLEYKYDFDTLYNLIVDSINTDDNISISTHIMQGLGYEGIDVTNIPEMDNTMYGSVIYDLKEDLSTSYLSAKELEDLVKQNLAEYETEDYFWWYDSYNHVPLIEGSPLWILQDGSIIECNETYDHASIEYWIDKNFIQKGIQIEGGEDTLKWGQTECYPIKMWGAIRIRYREFGDIVVVLPDGPDKAPISSSQISTLTTLIENYYYSNENTHANTYLYADHDLGENHKVFYYRNNKEDLTGMVNNIIKNINYYKNNQTFINPSIPESLNLTEAKQDEENFRSWFGDSLTDKFLAIKPRLKSPEKDFYYWKDKSKSELQAFIKSVENTKTAAQQREEAKAGADLIYNKDGWKVYKINTYEAANLYGKGTKWCIAGNYDGHEEEGKYWFNHYKQTQHVLAYYFIFSPNNEKWCYLYINKPLENQKSHNFFTAEDTGTTLKEFGADYLYTKFNFPEKLLLTLPGFEKYYKPTEYNKDIDTKLIKKEGEWSLYEVTSRGLIATAPDLYDYFSNERTKRVIINSPLDIQIGVSLGTKNKNPYIRVEDKDHHENGLRPCNFYSWDDLLSYYDVPLSIIQTIDPKYIPYKEEDNIKLIYQNTAGWEIYYITIRGMDHLPDTVLDNKKSKNYNFSLFKDYIKHNYRYYYNVYYMIVSPTKDMFAYYDLGSKEKLMADTNVAFEWLNKSKSRAFTYQEIEQVEEKIPLDVLQQLPYLNNLEKENPLEEIYSESGWHIYKTISLKEVSSHLNNLSITEIKRYLASYRQDSIKKLNSYYLISDDSDKTNWYCYIDFKSPSSNDTTIISNNDKGRKTNYYKLGDDKEWAIDGIETQILQLGIPFTVLNALPNIKKNIPTLKIIEEHQKLAEETLDNETYYIQDNNDHIPNELKNWVKKVVITKNVTDLSKWGTIVGPLCEEVEFEAPSSLKTISGFSYTKITSIEIPNSVLEIRDRTFSGCSSLQKVVIPNSVSEIGGYAFGTCKALTNIIIPNSVTSIEEGAFWGCKNLTSVTFESGGTEPLVIKREAFWDCHIKEITLPARTTEIKKEALFCIASEKPCIINIKGKYRPEIIESPETQTGHGATIKWIDAKKTQKLVGIYKEDLESLQESIQDETNFRMWFGDELTDRFLNLKPRLSAPENDFYYWKNKFPGDLSKFLDDVENTPTTKQTRTDAKAGADLIIEINGYKLYKINTNEAATLYGKHTEWCITSVHSPEFAEGTDMGDEYYFIIAPNDTKWCYVKDGDYGFGTSELWSVSHILGHIYNQEDDHLTVYDEDFGKIPLELLYKLPNINKNAINILYDIINHPYNNTSIYAKEDTLYINGKDFPIVGYWDIHKFSLDYDDYNIKHIILSEGFHNFEDEDIFDSFDLIDITLPESYQGYNSKTNVATFMGLPQDINLYISKEMYNKVSLNDKKEYKFYDKTTGKRFIIKESLLEAKQDELNFQNKFGDDLANRFLAIKNRIKYPENDFYYWIQNKDKKELEAFINSIENTKSNNELRKEVKKGAELIYNQNGWKIYKIDTYEAAALYGKGTTWCISGNYPENGGDARGRKYFKDYKERGVEDYYFIISPNNNKFAYLDWGTMSDFDEENLSDIFWDEDDTSITLSYDEEYQFPPIEVIKALPNVPYEYELLSRVANGEDIAEEYMKYNKETKTLEYLDEIPSNFEDLIDECRHYLYKNNLIGANGKPFKLFLGEDIHKIERELFKNSTVSEIEVTSDDLTIDPYAFVNCYFLEEINIPCPVTLNYNTFLKCYNLHTLKLSGKHNFINDSAFNFTSNKKDINIYLDGTTKIILNQSNNRKGHSSFGEFFIGEYAYQHSYVTYAYDYIHIYVTGAKANPYTFTELAKVSEANDVQSTPIQVIKLTQLADTCRNSQIGGNNNGR